MAFSEFGIQRVLEFMAAQLMVGGKYPAVGPTKTRAFHAKNCKVTRRKVVIFAFCMLKKTESIAKITCSDRSDRSSLANHADDF